MNVYVLKEVGTTNEITVSAHDLQQAYDLAREFYNSNLKRQSVLTFDIQRQFESTEPKVLLYSGIV